MSVGYQRVSAKRQSDRVEVNLTLSNSSAGPVTGEVAFEEPAGDFIVTIRATNEFGESELSERSIKFIVTSEFNYDYTYVRSFCIYMILTSGPRECNKKGALIGGTHKLYLIATNYKLH